MHRLNQSRGSRAARPPNIVLLMASQLRSFAVGAYGNPVSRTPEIDRLATYGQRFDIACANSPLGTTARGIAFSGQYARTCLGALGCSGDPEPGRRQLPAPTLVECLRTAGYDTAHIGKWCLPPRPAQLGFNYWVHPAAQHGYSGRRFFDNSAQSFLTDGWSWDFEMNLARSYLAQRRSQPFFLSFNIEPPHGPLGNAPKRYTQMYRPDQVPMRPNAIHNGIMAYDEASLQAYFQQPLMNPAKLPEGFNLRHLIAAYYGLVALADDQVGKLRRALDEYGLTENTIVVFTADHGDLLGSHQCFDKAQLYEEAIRIPMIYHWPAGLAPGRQSQQVTSLVDLAPTLLDLAGVALPGHLQGTSVAPVMQGTQEIVGDNLAWIECEGGTGMRTRDHLYGIRLADPSLTQHAASHEAIADDRLCFYDLREDPYQLDNLARTDAQALMAAELRDRLLAWHRRTPWLSHEPPLAASES
jgi:arylsulfatase A-like enzyme